jgi:Fe-S-cluster containining protein
MSAALTDILCTRCGLCCDGSLFADVELADEEEATGLEILGLDVEDDGEDGFALQQPCKALDGTRCGIYAHRPDCCRTFECRLLQDAKRGSVTVEQATARILETLGQIRHVEQLLGPPSRNTTRLSLKERCAEASSRSGRSARASDALAAAIAAVEGSIQRTFLTDPPPPSKERTQ